MKTESILPMHTKSTPQPQRQTSPQIKGWGKKLQSNGPKKQAGGAILISHKIDFKLKSIKRDKERTFHISHRKISIKRKSQY